MEWHEVYTESQKRRLINAACDELKRLIEFLVSKNPEGEFEITGFYGDLAPKIVWKDHALQQRIALACNIGEKDENKKPLPIYRYELISETDQAEIVEKYRIIPEHVAGVRAELEKRFMDRGDEFSAVETELKRMLGLPALKEMIRDLHIVGNDFTGHLFLTRDGLQELSGEYDKATKKYITVMRSIREDDMRRMIEKYLITLQMLSEARAKLER